MYLEQLISKIEIGMKTIINSSLSYKEVQNLKIKGM